MLAKRLASVEALVLFREHAAITAQVAKYAEDSGSMPVQWRAFDEGRGRATKAGETVASSRVHLSRSLVFVSVHIRLKPTIRGIISTEDLQLMETTATFINTSRLALVVSHSAVISTTRIRDVLIAEVDQLRV